MNRGIFITVEGPDGAGKTTIIQMIKEFLEKEGHLVLLTREPGGIPIAEQIRSVILNKDHIKMDGRTEALLYAAARRQHLVEKVIPALNKGYIVLCDRFIDSSLAYQGYARGLGIDEVRTINEFAIEGVWPDATFYFDLDPEEGLKRINKNNDREINRLDMEAVGFHQKVRDGYMVLIDRYKDRFHIIDASQEIQQVYEDTKEKIIHVIQNKTIK